MNWLVMFFMLLYGITFQVNAATAPTVTTRTANSITAVSASLRGTVISNGAITTVTFDYGTTISYGNTVTASQSPLAANANTNVSAAITGLSCNTTYYFRVNGTNSVGTNSAETTFITSACPKSTATTVAASSITATGATLNGTVSSNGSVTTVGFNYGLTTSYGSVATASPNSLAGNASNIATSSTITGLACGTLYHFQVTATNSGGITNGSDLTFTTLTCPLVTAINTISANPSSANLTVQWTVTFSTSVTGVDASDFALVQAGGVTGATITAVTGSGTTWTVSANTGTGAVGTLQLKLVDDDTIKDSTGTPLGGPNPNNGNFGGQSYTLIVPVCNNTMLFCDDFERTVIAGGSNASNSVGIATSGGAWTVSPLAATCAGTTTNKGCAGIDSDVAPWTTPSNPRANPTRAAFTRWSNVIVTSPVIDLSSLPSRSKAAQISFWLRRGSDCFSEWPGDNTAGCDATYPPRAAVTGEEFRVEYKNNTGTWVTLAQYPTEATPGEIMTPVIDLPDDALWSGFQLRFQQPNGSGSNSTNGGAAGIIGYDYWHFDNVIVTEQPAVPYAGAFCDTFESGLSRWTFTGVGNVQIGSTYFQNGAHDMDLRWNTVTATTKTTDMRGAIGDIRFWVKRGIGTMATGSYPNTTGSEFPETTAKGLQVDYFNSSNVWIPLTTFTGGGTAGQVFSDTLTPATNKFTLPSDAKHSKFKLRFTLQSGSGVYDEDYWHVDDVCVGSIIQTADLSLTKTSSGTFTPAQYVTYTLTVTNAGPNIEPGAVTITDTLPKGLSYQSSSAGWTCSAAGQVVSCTRAGALAVGASGVLTLTAIVDNTIAAGVITNSATVGGQSLDNNLTNNTATKADTVIVPSYVFTDKACLDGVPFGTGTQCALVNWSPQIAGQTLSNIYITAVNGLGLPTQLSSTNATNVAMQFALSCHNPSSNAGVAANFSAIGTLPLCTANGVTPSIWSTVTTLNFPAATASVGPYDFNYADVGNVELFMRNSAVTTQIGTSGAFVVRPANLVLSSIMPSSNTAGRCAVNPNSNPVCANAATDNAVFVKAGEAFKVTVTATTINGAITPNFGKEQTPETIRFIDTSVVSSDSNYANHGTLIAPIGGSNPAISGSFSSFSNGTATGLAFSWSDVGIIKLTPSIADGDYLGTGDIIGTTSTTIGRFYPDHFTVTANNGDMAAACGGFTYAGQPMRYLTAPSLTIKAMNALATPTITSNYSGSFQKLSTAGIVIATPTADATKNTALTVNKPTNTLKTGTLSNNRGTMTYTLNTTDDYEYTRDANAKISPYNSDIALIVAAVAEPTLDGVTATGGLPTLKPTGVTIRYGRMQFNNAYGSELLPLSLALQAQYYDNDWVVSNSDTCTVLNAANFAFAFPIAASNKLAACDTALTLTGNAPNFIATLSAPQKAGWSDITLNLATAATGTQCTTVGGVGALASTANFPWLQDNGINPSARATFGIYHENTKIIYRRELY